MKIITERRQAQRFVVSLNATAMTQDNYSCAIKISNISASGLNFLVKAEETLRLIPNEAQKNRLSPISITLDVQLHEGEPELIIQCGIVYIRRKSLNLNIVGCRFESFVKDASERLEKYLVELTNKNAKRLPNDKNN